MTKLTPAQKRVVDLMNKGWTLCQDKVPLPGGWWLDHADGGEEYLHESDVAEDLIDAGVVQLREGGMESANDIYELTEAYQKP